MTSLLNFSDEEEEEESGDDQEGVDQESVKTEGAVETGVRRSSWRRQCKFGREDGPASLHCNTGKRNFANIFCSCHTANCYRA